MAIVAELEGDRDGDVLLEGSEGAIDWRKGVEAIVVLVPVRQTAGTNHSKLCVAPILLPSGALFTALLQLLNGRAMPSLKANNDFWRVRLDERPQYASGRISMDG